MRKLGVNNLVEIIFPSGDYELGLGAGPLNY